jgi:hypothetical protein
MLKPSIEMIDIFGNLHLGCVLTRACSGRRYAPARSELFEVWKQSARLPDLHVRRSGPTAWAASYQIEEVSAMKYRTPLIWMVLVTCIGTSFVLGRISSLEPTHAPIAVSAALAPGIAATDDAKAFLPVVYKAAESSPQSQLATTVAALVEENAQQATNIAGWNTIISYVLTQVPAQNRVPTIEVLVYQHAHLSTEVAELYIALGSPIPTTPPSPTFGPSPTPTRTPFGPSPTPTQTPSPTP